MKSAERELIELSWKLDATDYDDEEEFEAVLNELYPEVVFETSKRAAAEGSVRGMHLYGRMLAEQAAELRDAGKEYESILEEGRSWVVKAAKNGCLGAMEDLGSEQTDLLDVPIELQLAFFQLSGGGDLSEHLDYLRTFRNQDVTPEHLKRTDEILEEVKAYMNDNQIESEMCECIIFA